MSRKKPTIPSPNALPAEVSRVLRPMKAILEDITGQVTGELSQVAPQLEATATTADLITRVNMLADRINQIVARLNNSGE